MNLLTEIQYNPPLQYFTELLQADAVLLEQHENYQKQSYRNRCHILTANGVQALTVPVLQGNSKINIRDVEIDYKQKWFNIHWRAIQSAYGKSPFFAYYADYLHQVYEQRPARLFDLNFSLLQLYLKFLNIKKSIILTNEYIVHYPDNTKDLRNKIHPKIQPDNLHVEPYYQVFGKQFVPNLSIMDLLFCQGPESRLYLKRHSEAGA